MPLSFDELREAASRSPSKKTQNSIHHNNNINSTTTDATSPARNVKLIPLSASSPTPSTATAGGNTSYLSTTTPTSPPRPSNNYPAKFNTSLLSSSPSGGASSPPMKRSLAAVLDVASVTAASRAEIYGKTVEDQRAVMLRGRDRLKGQLADRGIPFVRHHTSATSSKVQRKPQGGPTARKTTPGRLSASKQKQQQQQQQSGLPPPEELSTYLFEDISGTDTRPPASRGTDTRPPASRDPLILKSECEKKQHPKPQPVDGEDGSSIVPLTHAPSWPPPHQAPPTEPPSQKNKNKIYNPLDSVTVSAPPPNAIISNTLSSLNGLKDVSSTATELMSNYRQKVADQLKQQERKQMQQRLREGGGGDGGEYEDEDLSDSSDMNPDSPEAIARATVLARVQLNKQLHFKGTISRSFLEVVQRRNNRIDAKTKLIEERTRQREADEALQLSLTANTPTSQKGSGTGQVYVSSPVPFPKGTSTSRHKVMIGTPSPLTTTTPSKSSLPPILRAPPTTTAISERPLALLKSSELVSGDDAPFFTSEREWKSVPKGIISKRIHELKSNPDEWFEFSDTVSAIKTELTERQAASQDSIIGRNKLSVRTSVPTTVAKRNAAASRNGLHEARVEHAKEVADERCRSVLQAVTDREDRRMERQLERRRQLLVMAVLGSIHYKYCSAILKDRFESYDLRRTRAAKVFAYFWRRKKAKISHVKAFCIRARLLIRLLTRVRARVIRPRQVERAKNLLTSVTVYHRMFALIKELRLKAIRCQRLWRGRAKLIAFQSRIRILQFDNALTQRTADAVVEVSQLKQTESLQAQYIKGNGSSSGSHHPMPPPNPKIKKLDREIVELRRVTPEIRDAALLAFHGRQRAEFDKCWNVRYCSIAKMLRGELGFEEVPPKKFWRILISVSEMARLLVDARCRLGDTSISASLPPGCVNVSLPEGVTITTTTDMPMNNDDGMWMPMDGTEPSMFFAPGGLDNIVPEGGNDKEPVTSTPIVSSDPSPS